MIDLKDIDITDIRFNMTPETPVQISDVYWGNIHIWPDGTPPTPVVYYNFSINPTSITMTYSEQNITVTATTDSPSWQVLSCPSWMNLEGTTQVGGSWVIEFSVEENEGNTRTGNIEFQYQSNNEGATQTLQMPIVQNKFFGIKYQSTNNNVVPLNVTAGFGANYVSNTYSDGVGKVEFDGDITAIAAYAFSGQTNLYKITVPNSVTTIGTTAFSGCTSLAEFAIPDSVTSLGTSNFRGCSSLKSVSFGTGLSSVPNYSFTDCTTLSSITLSSSITSIGTAAFRNCPSIRSIVFPNVATVGNNAFSGCTNLTSVTMSTSISSIGSSAFTESIYLNVFYGGLYSQWLNVTQGTNSLAASATIHYKYNSKTSVNYVAYQSFTAGTPHQYMNLGIPLTTDTVITFNCRLVNLNVGSQMIGCRFTTGDSDDFRFFITNSRIYFDWHNSRVNDTASNMGQSLSSGSTAYYQLSNFRVTNLSNSKYKSGTTQTTVPSPNAMLAVNTNKWWIKSVKITQGGVTKLDMSAAVCDNVAGFYDSVTDTFLTIDGLRSS